MPGCISSCSGAAGLVRGFWARHFCFWSLRLQRETPRVSPGSVPGGAEGSDDQLARASAGEAGWPWPCVPQRGCRDGMACGVRVLPRWERRQQPPTLESRRHGSRGVLDPIGRIMCSAVRARSPLRRRGRVTAGSDPARGRVRRVRRFCGGRVRRRRGRGDTQRWADAPVDLVAVLAGSDHSEVPPVLVDAPFGAVGVFWFHELGFSGVDAVGERCR